MRKLISVSDYAKYKGCPVEEIEFGSDKNQWSSPNFDEYFIHGNLHVARLPNILYVRRFSAMVTEEGWILSDATLNEFARAASSFKNLPTTMCPPWHEKSGPSILIGGQDNFYHWIFNWLSKFPAIEKSSICGGVHDLIVSGPVSRFHWETLFKLRAAQNRNVYFHEGDAPIFVRDAIVPTLHSNPVHAPHQIEYLRSLINADTPSRFGQKIYITRRDAPNNARQLLNEDSVWSALQNLGFQAVALGDLSFDEQAAAFRSAKYIVSPHGAGLANLIHCSPQTYILEMQSKDHFTKVYWSLGVFSQARRYDIFPCVSSGNKAAYLQNITVDVEAMMRVLRERWGL